MKKFYIVPCNSKIDYSMFGNVIEREGETLLEIKNSIITEETKNFEEAMARVKCMMKKFIKGSVSQITISGEKFTFTFNGIDTEDTFMKFNMGVFSNNLPQYEPMRIELVGELIPTNKRGGYFKVAFKEDSLVNGSFRESNTYCNIDGSTLNMLSDDNYSFCEMAMQVKCISTPFGLNLYSLEYKGVNSQTGETLCSPIVSKVSLNKIPAYLKKYSNSIVRANTLLDNFAV